MKVKNKYVIRSRISEAKFRQIILLLSFTYAGYIIIRTMVLGIELPGYASMLVAVLFLGGLNLFAIGFVGEYIGRIYQEVKSRPIYLVKEQKEKNEFI